MAERILENDQIADVFETKEIVLTDSKKLIITLKRFQREMWLDVRHWVRFRGKTEYFPTKKGIFIELGLFKRELLPLISKICE